MVYEDILYSVSDGVAVITLNRPDRLNAWRGEMARDVKAAMRAASDDDAVRVIVLTGAGRGFCAGADMNMLQAIQSDGASARAAAGPADFDPQARADFRMQNSWFPAVPKP
ncbi:enoyl-CoA hydratase/isomerase family protein, partial [Sandarakinorhabdus limnophila]